MDAGCIESYADGASFEEWASDMGADSDSISAKETYEALVKTSRVLRKAMGQALFERFVAASGNL